MKHTTLITASGLRNWANGHEHVAQDNLPRIIRSLIAYTSPKAKISGFAADEGVNIPGVDGKVFFEAGDGYVPKGLSIWEMGASKDVKDKADGDYKKRSEKPLAVDRSSTTFVFVTPLRYRDKEKWMEEKRAHKIWHDVVMYDADDLEAWLDNAYPVHIWLSRLAGQRPEGLNDPFHYWAAWSRKTSPETSLDLILSGRQSVVESIKKWLISDESVLHIKGDSREEACIFFVAALLSFSAIEKDLYLSQTVVVTERKGWDAILESQTGCILLQAFFEDSNVGAASQFGNRIVIPLGRSDIGVSDYLAINRSSRDSIAIALTTMGIPESDLRELSILCRRSFLLLRRKLSISKAFQKPSWAAADVAHDLIPALFVGAWEDGMLGDQTVLAALARRPYEEVRAYLTRLINLDDAPIRLSTSVWYLLSKDQIWDLISSYSTLSDFELYKEHAITALTTVDLQYDLAEEDRSMQVLLVEQVPYSSRLLNGIVDTLAMMGSREEVILGTRQQIKLFVAKIVSSVLSKANRDWRIWATLSPQLSLMAEAAPDEFLSALEEDLRLDEPVIMRLFGDRKARYLFAHTSSGLLSALECLAWSPDFFGRVCLVLAKIASNNPSAKSNSPGQALHTLKGLFSTWLPQTSVPLSSRHKTLDLLRKAYPNVAWSLICSLIPSGNDVGMYSHRPKWHDWAPSRTSNEISVDHDRAISEILTRFFEDVGENGDRWVDLLDKISIFRGKALFQVLAKLEVVSTKDLSQEEKAKIWSALRSIISRHRSYPEADWAFEITVIDQINSLYEAFEPSDYILHWEWLFDGNPHLPQGLDRDWRARLTEIEIEQKRAVTMIYKEQGLHGIKAFAESVSRSMLFGQIIAVSNVMSDDDIQIMLMSGLGSASAVMQEFIFGFIGGLVTLNGYDWAVNVYRNFPANIDATWRARFLSPLPHEKELWNIVESEDGDVQSEYWRLYRCYGTLTWDNVIIVAPKLIKHNRSASAVTLFPHDEPVELTTEMLDVIADALEGSVSDFSDHQDNMGMFPYDAVQLFKKIQASSFDRVRLAKLEYLYLPIFRDGEYSANALYEALSENPDLFVEAVEMLYRAENEPKRVLSQLEEAKVTSCYHFLDSWENLPGIKSGDQIDPEKIRIWVQKVRARLQLSGRGKICDQLIGRQLVNSPADINGVWPHIVIRDLIEELASAHVDIGFMVAIRNSRGVHTREVYEGGAQEIVLKEKYLAQAKTIEAVSPRVAKLLRQIGDEYGTEALAENEEADLLQDLS